MIEEDIWFNGSRDKLKFEKFKGIFYLTPDKNIAMDYIDDGEKISGYLNTIDISKLKADIFDFRTDFNEIVGKKFKATWTDKIIEIDESFKKLLAKDWNSWALTERFDRSSFIKQVLIPMGYKGYYNIETDDGVSYKAIGIFVKYLNELNVIKSEKVDLDSFNDEDSYDDEESFDENYKQKSKMTISEAKQILANNGYKLV